MFISIYTYFCYKLQKMKVHILYIGYYIGILKVCVCTRIYFLENVPQKLKKILIKYNFQWISQTVSHICLNDSLLNSSQSEQF